MFVAPILNKFKERVNGTTATLTPPFLSWNYFASDPDWGQKKAAQVIIELEASLARHDVKISQNVQGSVEIIPYGAEKSVVPNLLFSRLLRNPADCAALKSLGTSFNGNFPRFVLAIGDDKSDDKLFEVRRIIVSINYNVIRTSYIACQ